MHDDNDWTEYRRLVLSQLDANKSAIEMLSTKIDTVLKSDISDMKVNIAMLQMKAGVWGLMAGLIPVIAMALWLYMGGHK